MEMLLVQPTYLMEVWHTEGNTAHSELSEGQKEWSGSALAGGNRQLPIDTQLMHSAKCEPLKKHMNTWFMHLCLIYVSLIEW